MDRNLITMYRIKLIKPLIGMSSNGQIMGLPRAHNVLVAIVETPQGDYSNEDIKEVGDIIDGLCDLEDNLNGRLGNDSKEG